ncbi:hypothetical protein CBM2626_U40018 [Cupriavidus taiwanensis]|uniref:Uncharacterized protein n=1 Tax=Cupriavidus taiwanensis TaxID=164546 RepID=A0A375EFE1_9BURK|nr:hypothetical protein CBM2615_U30016 [Cupriavidus taiwanensis]SOZ75344.1 hypothetical protein CBM2613_U30016 [Cupriavidus taiwanensis]SPA03880.1 hypothetical protein CBM2626_U40018 [Cupriavidus taiwanensis]
MAFWSRTAITAKPERLSAHIPFSHPTILGFDGQTAAAASLDAPTADARDFAVIGVHAGKASESAAIHRICFIRS